MSGPTESIRPAIQSSLLSLFRKDIGRGRDKLGRDRGRKQRLSPEEHDFVDSFVTAGARIFYRVQLISTGSQQPIDLQYFRISGFFGNFEKRRNQVRDQGVAQGVVLSKVFRFIDSKLQRYWSLLTFEDSTITKSSTAPV
jgi:hypothetical protein